MPLYQKSYMSKLSLQLLKRNVLMHHHQLDLQMKYLFFIFDDTKVGKVKTYHIQFIFVMTIVGGRWQQQNKKQSAHVTAFLRNIIFALQRRKSYWNTSEQAEIWRALMVMKWTDRMQLFKS